MKNALLLGAIAIVFAGAGCEARVDTTPAEDEASAVSPVVEELESQEVEETPSKEPRPEVDEEETSDETKLYKGTYFDVTYPAAFAAKPSAPTSTMNGINHVMTDEAYFLSPDETVEFFVFSPLWGGDPMTYTGIAPSEELVSEKTEEMKEDDVEGQFGDKIVRWVTVKANDGSYTRSFVSIRTQVGTGSDLHHVFGIKYQDQESYEKYRDAYIAFKSSLKQYSH